MSRNGAVLFAALAGLAGCQLITGTYDLVDSRPDGASSSSGGSSGSSSDSGSGGSSGGSSSGGSSGSGSSSGSSSADSSSGSSGGAGDAASCPVDGGVVTHTNGVGQTFTNATPCGTYTLAMASDACAKYAGAMGGSVANCVYPLGCKGKTDPHVCYEKSPQTCVQSTTVCWGYGDANGAAQAGDVIRGCTCNVTGSWQ